MKSYDEMDLDSYLKNDSIPLDDSSLIKLLYFVEKIEKKSTTNDTEVIKQTS